MTDGLQGIAQFGDSTAADACMGETVGPCGQSGIRTTTKSVRC